MSPVDHQELPEKRNIWPIAMDDFRTSKASRSFRKHVPLPIARYFGAMAWLERGTDDASPAFIIAGTPY